MAADCPLWEFALAFYARPAVRADCLRLQDEHGLRVNLLLAACYLAGHRQWLDATAWQALGAATRDWHETVVQPQRQQRRSLPPGPAREQALAQEIAAERHELQHIATVLAVLQPQRAATAGDAARQSLQAYWDGHHNGKPVPAALQGLARAAEIPA